MGYSEEYQQPWELAHPLHRKGRLESNIPDQKGEMQVGRQLRVRLRRRFSVGFLVVVAGVALTSWLLTRSAFKGPDSIPEPASSDLQSRDPFLGARLEDFRLQGSGPSSPRRLVYPYSVIPGGVQSGSDLKDAVKHDPVVANHYSDFQVARAMVVRVEKEKAAYVSYRLGDHVFWTKRKFFLHPGETLITDGVHIARGRCGNRVSETPSNNISPNEPTPEALETPLDPVMLHGLDQPLLMALTPPPATDINPIEKNRIPPGGSFFIPPIVPISGGGGPHNHTPPPGPPIIPPPPPPPVTPTPEPGTLLLLGTGLVAGWASRKHLKR